MASNRTKNKKLVSFSVDTNTLIKFNKMCKDTSINKSLLIENIMKKLLIKSSNNTASKDLKYFLENYEE